MEGKQKILIFHPQTPESCSSGPPWGTSPWSIPVSGPPVQELTASLQASQFPKASPVLVFTEGLPIAHQSRPWPLWHFPGAALVHIGAQALLALLAPLIPTALHQLQLVASALDSGHCSIPKDHSLRGQTQDSFGTARSR